MDTKLLRFQFWAVFITFNGTFISLIAVGILGMTRRDDQLRRVPATAQRISASVFAFGLGASMALFLGILHLGSGHQAARGRRQPVGVARGRVAGADSGPDRSTSTGCPTSWSLPYDYDTGKPATDLGPATPALSGA